MKCPRCGMEMTLDSHRKIPLQMCYSCGYIEGRTYEAASGTTNYARLKVLNINEMTVFLSAGLGIDEKTVGEWLEQKS